MISFLLPTIRSVSYPDMLKSTIDSIVNNSTDFEILISSDVEIRGENVRCFIDNKRGGPLSAFNFLAGEANGDYVVCVVDDHKLDNSVTLALDLLESDIYYNQKFKITSLSSGLDNIPNIGDQMGDRIINEILPVVPTLKFPVIRSDCLKLLKDKIFPPKLVYHAGDIWLSYFLAINDNIVRVSKSRITQLMQLKDPSHEVDDCNKVYNMILKHINEGYMGYY